MQSMSGAYLSATERQSRYQTVRPSVSRPVVVDFAAGIEQPAIAVRLMAIRPLVQLMHSAEHWYSKSSNTAPREKNRCHQTRFRDSKYMENAFATETLSSRLR